jgi:cell division protein FtsQ
MTEIERDLNRQRSTSDPGRARKRKLKRDSAPDVSTQAESSPNRRKAARQRASSRSGPSIRERLVATQIKIQTVSFPSIQGKLSSKLGLDSHQSTTDQSSRKTSSFSDGVTPHTPHRKAQSRGGESLYKATPRAETQRISNAEHGTLPRKGRRVYDARSEAAPPVMVRGGMGGMAFGRVASSRLHKQRTPKRRIDVPLNVTGAELRLPSIPFLHLGWRAVSLMMVLMMTASLFLIWKAPVFQVNSVEAEGLQRLTVGDLNAVMGTLGKSVFTINPNFLDETLHQAFPELSKISVRVNLPAKVKVVVTERVPVIAWIQDDIETWVDAEGFSFPPRGTPTTALVRVEGHGTPPSIAAAASPGDLQGLPEGVASATTPNNPTLRLSPELVSAILSLGAKMPADTLLVYDSEHGLGWNDPSGWEVFFGAEDQDMEMKLTVYQALVDRLQSEGIQPAMISVEYVHAPYYRMER